MYQIYVKELSASDTTYTITDTSATSSKIIDLTATTPFDYTDGSSYYFKIVAKNKYGFSDTTTAIHDGSSTTARSSAIKVAARPKTPAAPITSIATGSTYVRIDWTATPTSDSNYDTVFEYEISIQTGSSDTTVYTIDSTYCNGASLPIVGQKYCEIPISALRSSPYSYSNVNQQILAKFRQKNLRGWSDTSAVSTTVAYMQTVPSVITTVAKGASTTDTAIHIQWSALTTAVETGRVSILSYNLQWNAGVTSGPWIDVVGNTYATPAQAVFTDTSIILTTGIVAGTTYKF